MAINKATSGYVYFHATSTTMTTEAMTSAAGNIYQITDTDHQVIDPAVAVTVNHSAAATIDTTWMDEGIDYYTGRVKLAAADTPTIDGAYLTMTTLASVVSWSLNPVRNAAEVTALGDDWKKYTAIEEGATLTLNRYYVDTEMWSHLNAGSKVLVQLWENASAGFWCAGYISSFNPSVAVGAVDTEAVTIQLDGPISRF